MRASAIDRIKRGLRHGIRRTGFDITRTPESAALPPDFEPDHCSIVEAVKSRTATSPERIYVLIEAVKYIVANSIPGSIVECGVWKGGSMMAVAQTLLRLNCRDRDLYLFDTFEGMTGPSNLDTDAHGRLAAEMLDEVRCYAGLDEVQDAMFSTGYSQDRIAFVRGRVEDTVPSAAPKEIALLRLDTDWYESTRHELIHLFPRLSPGGVLIIDDYGHWKGARLAVDEYFRENRVPILLNRIDYTGRIAIKLV